jgi:hypothetical protein
VRDVADNKRALAALTQLKVKYGDVRLSEAIQRETNRRPGPRGKWDMDRLLNLYLDVETAKERGMNQRQACMAIANFWNVSLKVVEKRHLEARKRLEGAREYRERKMMVERWNSMTDFYLFFGQQAENPHRLRFIEFLRTYKSAAKTRRI